MTCTLVLASTFRSNHTHNMISSWDVESIYRGIIKGKKKNARPFWFYTHNRLRIKEPAISSQHYSLKQTWEESRRNLCCACHLFFFSFSTCIIHKQKFRLASAHNQSWTHKRAKTALFFIICPVGQLANGERSKVKDINRCTRLTSLLVLAPTIHWASHLFIDRPEHKRSSRQLFPETENVQNEKE